MDEADADSEVVAATDGVTLRKRYEEAEFHQPAVVYEFASDREAESEVRLIETIPDELSAEDLGFLGSTMERTWQIKGPKLVFENPLAANESFTTAVAARGEQAEAITALLGHPDVFEVHSDGEAGDSPGEGDEQPAADVSEEPPASVAEAATPAGEGEPVVERFVAELRADEVSADSLAYLREELGVERPPTSVAVRLDQLQADVADVRAYTNALEAFLDDHGRADEVVDRLADRLDTLEASMEDVEERVRATDGTVADFEAQLEDLGADLAALAADLEALEDRLEDLEAAMDRVAERVPAEDVEERLDALESDLDEVSAFTKSLRSAFER